MQHGKSAYGRGLILVLLATCLWSTSGLFINLVVRSHSISSLNLAFWRDFCSFLSLLVGVAVFRPALLRVQRRDLPWLAAMGAISIGTFHVLWNMSILMNGVSVATVVQCNAPIFVTVMAWLLWRESLSWPKLVAIVLACAGTVLIAGLVGNPAGNALGGGQITTLGLLIGLASAITYGSYSLFGKKLAGGYSPWTILLYIYGFGALALLPFQIGSPLPWPLSVETLSAFAGMLYPTIAGFALYTAGLRHLPASVAAIAATAEVPLASIVSYIALGERLGVWQILGAVLVVSGVVLLSWTPGRLGYKRSASAH